MCARPYATFVSVGCLSESLSLKLSDQLAWIGKREVAISLNTVSCTSINHTPLPLSFSSFALTAAVFVCDQTCGVLNALFALHITEVAKSWREPSCMSHVKRQVMCRAERMVCVWSVCPLSSTQERYEKRVRQKDDGKYEKMNK